MNDLLNRIAIFISIFFFVQAKAQNISFQKIYNHDQWDFGFQAQQTSDGGFMLFGASGHNGLISFETMQ